MASRHALPTSVAQSRRARCDAGGGGGPSDDVAAPAEVAVVRGGADEIAGRALLRNRMKMPRLWKEAAESTLIERQPLFAAD